jgi:hypothetical protein
MLRLWDWMRMHIPYMFELDHYIKGIIIKRIKKKLRKND